MANERPAEPHRRTDSPRLGRQRPRTFGEILPGDARLQTRFRGRRLGVFALGGFKIMLGECSDEMPASATNNHSYFAHVLVDEVDSLFSAFRDRGARFLFEVEDKPWGLREFGVVTPDGHRICFAQKIAN